MVDAERVKPVLRELHHMGVRLAIDDFGSGHSSSARLRDVPVDVLKIDQSLSAACRSTSAPPPSSPRS